MYTINGHYKTNIVENFDENNKSKNVTTGLDVLTTLATELTNGKYYINSINFAKNENMYIKKENESIDMMNSIGSINIKSKNVDGKQGDIVLTGKNININGNMCIGNTCIDEQQLKDIKSGYFNTLETNNIYIRNNSKDMPKIRIYASSESGKNERPEMAIVTDNEKNWGGIYIKPGNRTNVKSKITMVGGDETSDVLVNGREGYIKSAKPGHNKFLFDGPNNGGYFDRDTNSDPATKMIFYSA